MYHEQICNLTAEELDGWVLEALDNCHVKVERQIWTSDVNQYIRYDERPHCTQSMKCTLSISSNVYFYISFFMYCFNKHKKLRDKLEKMLELKCDEVR